MSDELTIIFSIASIGISVLALTISIYVLMEGR